jgi:hypothetical protein
LTKFPVLFPAAAHTRIGWFRSVSNIPHAFAVHNSRTFSIAIAAWSANVDTNSICLEKNPSIRWDAAFDPFHYVSLCGYDNLS